MQLSKIENFNVLEGYALMFLEGFYLLRGSYIAREYNSLLSIVI